MTRYSFQPLHERDLDLVARWLARPHVARWWPDAKQQVEKIRRWREEPWIAPYLILLDRRPVGHIQTYDPEPAPDGDCYGQPSGTRGIDLFIGEADLIGQGHGTAVIRQMAERLLAEPGVVRVIGDPAPDNRASIRAFEKAGFRDTGEIELPDGPARLMVLSAVTDPA